MPQRPVPTHSAPNKDDGSTKDPYVTPGEVLEYLRTETAQSLPNMKNCRITAMEEGHNGALQLHPTHSAPAIRAGGPPILHYAEKRCINVREAATLQSFPLHYEFFGKPTSMYRQVGNAVPVEFSRAIGATVRDRLRFYFAQELNKQENDE